MDNNFVRVLLIYYYLSDLKKHTAEELADRLEVSKRTISNDVRQLQNFSEYHGTHLICSQEGYSLQVFDEEEFDATVLGIQRSVMAFPVISGSVNAIGRPLDILGTLICAEERMTLDDLADKFFMSKESLKKDYKKVRDILRAFCLSYNVYNRVETNIIGKEFDKRMCMLYLNHPLHFSGRNDLEFFSREQAAVTRFFKSEPAVDKARKAIVQKELPMAVRWSAGSSGRLQGYLTLSANRLKCGFRLEYTGAEKDFLRQFAWFELAKSMTERSLRLSGLDYDENETFGLEQYMLMYMDLDTQNYDKEDFGPIYGEAKETAAEISDWLYRQYGFRLSKVECYAERMTVQLMPILVQMRFGAQGYYRNYIKNGEFESFGDPFGNLMGMQVHAFLQGKYDVEFSRYNQSMLGRTISGILSGVESPRIHQKIAICNNFGIETARELIRILEQVLPRNYIYDWKLLGEGRGAAEADLTICQGVDSGRGIGGNSVYVDLIPKSEQIMKLCRFFIEREPKESRFYSAFQGPPAIWKNYEFHGKEAFVNEILDNLCAGKDETYRNLISKYLKLVDFSCCFNGTCVLIIPREMTDAPFFAVYSLKDGKNAKWSGRHITTLMVLSFDCGEDPQMVRFVRDFLVTVTGDRGILKDFIETGDPEKAETKMITI